MPNMCVCVCVCVCARVTISLPGLGVSVSHTHIKYNKTVFYLCVYICIMLEFHMQSKCNFNVIHRQ